jgi:hypothetical protein
VVSGVTVATAYLTHRGGPAHTVETPPRLGDFFQRPQLEQQMHISELQRQVIAHSAGQASHVRSAIYENSAGAAGSAPPQIILFIGGNLAGASPGGFISSFAGEFSGAHSTQPGTLGGQAFCVSAPASASGKVALCAWADNDTFGVVASPTMSVAQLSVRMRAFRPALERPVR